jgi:hypothetical protein
VPGPQLLPRNLWQRSIARPLVPSVLTLTAANLIPLAGVLWFGWQVFALLLLFWLENVVVGVFNVLRMLAARPADRGAWGAKLFMIPFFCVHYGMFTAVHGVFVIAIFGRGAWNGSAADIGPVVRSLRPSGLVLSFAALALSHAFSFVWNYIGHGEYRTAELAKLMVAPYARVVVMHLTILGGGFLVMMLGSPVPALVVLVVLKILVDVGAHVGEHETGRAA